jgi:hypothetical protein
VGFIRIGLWEQLLAGQTSAYIHLAVFQYHCVMIFWAHFKCMTTDPGSLPKNYDSIMFKKLQPDMQRTLKNM